MVDGPDFSEDARVDELRNLDAFGHGTHLAGIIAAVAPQARVVNVKVADHDGSTSLGRLLAGIDWAVRRGDRGGLNIRVLNLAFGAEADGSYRNDPLAFAVERAWDEGVTVITSAGNGGADADSLDSPAYDPYVVAVGAEDSGGTATLDDDGMALFSSRGSTRAARTSSLPASPSSPPACPARSSTRPSPPLASATASAAPAPHSPPRSSPAPPRCWSARGPASSPTQVKALLRSTARPLAGHGHVTPGRRRDQRRRRRRAAVPAGVRQRFPDGRASAAGMRDALENQHAVGEPRGATAGPAIAGRAIAGRAIAGRAIAGRAIAGRATLVEQSLVEQPLVECRMGRGFVMSGRKWNPSV